MARITLALLVWLLAAPVCAQEYTNPIGIPTPPFGTTETAPARPSPWTSDTAGYYYIDQSTGTDSGRTYGNPTAPRLTIPTTLSAGAYVEVHGTYATNHSTPINCAGTSGSPCWIMGQNTATRPTITGFFYVGGSYTILQYLTFEPTSAAGKWATILTTNGDTTRGDHLVLRHSEITGNGSDSGGLGVFDAAAAGGQPTYVVVWNVSIHDAGDYTNDIGDNDYHCLTTTYSHHIWFVGNDLTRCEGDGLQVTGVGPASYDGSLTHHIYFGLNRSGNHKQNGAWSKFATDVIFSQNYFYTNKASNSSDGVCAGAQYDTDYLWILFNRCYDSDYGFAIGSDIDSSLTLNQFFVGNVVWGMTDSAGVYAARSGDGFSNCAFTSRASGNKYYYHNTAHNSSGHGFCIPGSPLRSAAAYYDNILDGVHASTGRHFYIDNAATTIVSGGNLLAPNYSQNIGGTVTTLAAPQTLSGNSLVRSTAEFANLIGENYHLNNQSAAVNIDTGGNAQALYDSYLSRYGVGIQVNQDGSPRPSGLYDAGAYELQSRPVGVPFRRIR